MTKKSNRNNRGHVIPIREVKVEEKKQFLYCNQASLSSSPWDVLFDFNRVSPKFAKQGSTQEISIEEGIQISMSPAHAKVFLGLLIEQITSYEKNVGKITLLKDAEETFNRQSKLIK